MGIYYCSAGSSSNKKLDAYHADTSFTMPMDLYLYNYYGENSEQIFGWNPNEEQWWITGFNPKHVGKIDVHKQVMIGCVNFSGYEDLYKKINAAKDSFGYVEKKKYLFFDEGNYCLWICWYV